jgi:hypothetical protein
LDYSRRLKKNSESSLFRGSKVDLDDITNARIKSTN